MRGAGFNDEAGEQRYAEEVARRHEAPGDGAVGGTRPGVVEMVVAEHDTSRTEPDGILEHPVWTDADAVPAARSHDDLLADGPTDHWPCESGLHAEAATHQSGAPLDGGKGR